MMSVVQKPNMSDPGSVEHEFEGAGLKPGLEVWYIDDNVKPVRVPESSYGVFFSACAYVLLRTHESDGSLSHDLFCWLGEDLSQAEVESVKVKVLELHGALKNETTPSWMKQSEDCAGFFTSFGVQCMIYRIGRTITDAGVRFWSLYAWNEDDRILQEVVGDGASLSDDCIFVLDTATKIFMFNCFEPLMEGPEKLVQQIKNTFHEGDCKVAVIGDRTMSDGDDAKQFWNCFGTPNSFGSKSPIRDARGRLFGVVNGLAILEADIFYERDLLDTEQCYVVDSGFEVYVWMGIKSSLQERNSASAAAKHLLCSFRRPNDNIIRVLEGFEKEDFRTLCDDWPVTVAGVNVEGLPEAPLSKEDCNGILEVWRMDGDTKSPLIGADRSKFYTGDCYIFCYTYPGELGEEHLVGTWFGLRSLEVWEYQVAMFEGDEPIQFLSIFQNLIVYQGGLSTGYKKFIATEGLQDATSGEDGLEYASRAIAREVPDNGRLYQCWFPRDTSNFQRMKMKRFDLDTLGTGGIFILDLNLDIYVWVGQEAKSKHKDAFSVAKEYLDCQHGFSPHDRFPIFIIMEGSEPAFFRRKFRSPVVKTAVPAVRYRNRQEPEGTSCEVKKQARTGRKRSHTD